MHPGFIPIFWATAGGAFGRSYLRHREELRRRETMSRDAVDRLQWQALQRILKHAYDHVPFYRARFDDAGQHPDRIRTPEEFRQVPLLTRDHLQQHLEEMVASNYGRDRLRRNQTGGSTGVPVAFYDHDSNRALQKATILRSRRWAGFEEGQKIAIIWGADRDLPTWSWFERFKLQQILRQRWLNSYHLTPEKMERFAEQMIRWQPRYILGYAAAVYTFACFLRERKLEQIRPVAIETSAEKLWSYQRELIEDVFRCKVFDAYGSRDVPNIAFECDTHSGLHVLSDNVYLELLADGHPVAPAETGEVVVTQLTNFAMPLIRYRNGDLARASAGGCSCGKPFPLLEEVVGRSNDLIATSRGDLVHGAFFNHLFFGIEGVRQFQVRQKTLQRLEISVRSDLALSDETLDGLRENIRNQLGEDVEIVFEQVDSIEPSPTGKHRYILSDLAPGFADRS